nr:MAG TPA: hypothetical protein [Caudoviricetes sp.]
MMFVFSYESWTIQHIYRYRKHECYPTCNQ